jgi:hypothetical protein
MSETESEIEIGIGDRGTANCWVHPTPIPDPEFLLGLT